MGDKVLIQIDKKLSPHSTGTDAIDSISIDDGYRSWYELIDMIILPVTWCVFLLQNLL